MVDATALKFASASSLACLTAFWTDSKALFAAATALYGLTFAERPELARHLYRPGIRVFEVTGEDGAGVGLFVADLFARPTKSGGAWMHTVRDMADALGEDVGYLMVIAKESVRKEFSDAGKKE